MSKNQKIALFGGTFDPPHLAHTRIAGAAIETFELDEVYFIPCWQSPLKDEKVTDAGHRLEMLKLAIEEKKEFKISDFELRNPAPSYSYITMEHFQGRFPEAKLYWIVGSDQWEDLDRWKNLKRMVELAEFIVYPRPDAPKKRSDGITCLKIEAKPIDICATMIRENVHDLKRIQPLLLPQVYQYIIQHKLYEKN